MAGISTQVRRRQTKQRFTLRFVKLHRVPSSNLYSPVSQVRDIRYLVAIDVLLTKVLQLRILRALGGFTRVNGYMHDIKSVGG